ncbi:fluoroquinolones export ATP-binding protein/MT2762 [bacterium BMS3Abin02]|nr:fluoroquinolones export ATP-binding protein/MT2762 [bacterium BMS3Abin02]GBE21492.1 fluoroquinolones export ATP-binding protein/MT2762 [bacterium BMS3Bbin01]HDL50130.1 ABC transporter ATP-binding protein [Actinomycetota bacterium]
MPAVEVQGLRRIFKVHGRASQPVVALDGIDLTVEEGTIHGLLGPNGAGKTTLVKILATVLIPTEGTASVLGFDVVAETARVRPLIGLVFGGDRGLYTRLTARQNLIYWAALYGVSASETPAVVDRLLDRVGLANRAGERVETFSRGMKQRLHLARGLVSDPPVLFLDEPTIGLDPMASLEFRRLVAELRDNGKTVFLTTHNMAEAEALCDRVSLIDRGRILATESPTTLGLWMSRYEWVEAQHVLDEVVAEIELLVADVERRPDGWVRFQPDADGVGRRVLRHLVDAGVSSVRTGSPSLEDVYMKLIGDRGMEL